MSFTFGWRVWYDFFYHKISLLYEVNFRNTRDIFPNWLVFHLWVFHHIWKKAQIFCQLTGVPSTLRSIWRGKPCTAPFGWIFGVQLGHRQMELTDEYHIKSTSVLSVCTASSSWPNASRMMLSASSWASASRVMLPVHSVSTDGDMIGYSSVNFICWGPSWRPKIQLNGAVIRRLVVFLVFNSVY